MEGCSMIKKNKKSINWTKDLLLKFFEIYENYPCLYDTRSNFYSNKHARADALFKICENLDIPNITPDDIKLKINNIRSQLSNELKKVKTPKSGMGTEETYEPVWWFDHAQFLIPYMKSRKGKDSLDESVDEHTQSDEAAVDNLDIEDTSASQSSRPKKLRKTIETSDDTYEKTVDALTMINSNLLKIQENENREVEFGNMIAKELSLIDDEEILLELKHEINNSIYKHKKQFLGKIKGNNI